MIEFWAALGYTCLNETLPNDLYQATQTYERPGVEIQRKLAGPSYQLRLSMWEACLIGHFYGQPSLRALLSLLRQDLKFSERANLPEDKDFCAALGVLLIDGRFRKGLEDNWQSELEAFLDGRVPGYPLVFSMTAEKREFLRTIGERASIRESMSNIATDMWKPGTNNPIEACPEGAIFGERPIECLEPGDLRNVLFFSARVLKSFDPERLESLWERFLLTADLAHQSRDSAGTEDRP